MARPPNYPVIVVHLDDDGYTACSGSPMPYPPSPVHDHIPRYACPGCFHATIRSTPPPPPSVGERTER